MWSSGAATLAGFDLKLRFCLSFSSSATRLVGSRLAGTFQISVVHSLPRSSSHAVPGGRRLSWQAPKTS